MKKLLLILLSFTSLGSFSQVNFWKINEWPTYDESKNFTFTVGPWDADWTIVAQQVNSNTITLAVVLQQVDIEPWGLTRVIPAGKYVRIRYGNVTGTATAAINSQQQENTF